MRAFHIENNTVKYQKIFSSGHQTTGAPLTDAQLAVLAPGAHVLTGNRSKQFGGGPSPYGFVIVAGAVVGYVNLQVRGLVGNTSLSIRI
jgi:hypothetical protein